MKQKIYILQKHLPGVSAGVKFIKGEDGWYNPIPKECTMRLHSNYVEHMPEWFLEEDPKVGCLSRPKKLSVEVRVTPDTTIGEYIEWTANKIDFDGEYYFLPYLFKREQSGMLLEVPFDKCPTHVKHAIVRLMP